MKNIIGAEGPIDLRQWGFTSILEEGNRSASEMRQDGKGKYGRKICLESTGITK